MNRSLFKPKFFFSLALCAALAGGAAKAQPAKDYQPEVGQAGKDVVWVPTPQALVDKMLDMAKLTPKDYLIDLGSGDGRSRRRRPGCPPRRTAIHRRRRTR